MSFATLEAAGIAERIFSLVFESHLRSTLRSYNSYSRIRKILSEAIPEALASINGAYCRKALFSYEDWGHVHSNFDILKDVGERDTQTAYSYTSRVNEVVFSMSEVAVCFLDAYTSLFSLDFIKTPWNSVRTLSLFINYETTIGEIPTDLHAKFADMFPNLDTIICHYSNLRVNDMPVIEAILAPFKGRLKSLYLLDNVIDATQPPLFEAYEHFDFSLLDGLRTLVIEGVTLSTEPEDHHYQGFCVPALQRLPESLNYFEISQGGITEYDFSGRLGFHNLTVLNLAETMTAPYVAGWITKLPKLRHLSLVVDFNEEPCMIHPYNTMGESGDINKSFHTSLEYLAIFDASMIDAEPCEFDIEPNEIDIYSAADIAEFVARVPSLTTFAANPYVMEEVKRIIDTYTRIPYNGPYTRHCKKMHFKHIKDQRCVDCKHHCGDQFN